MTFIKTTRQHFHIFSCSKEDKQLQKGHAHFTYILLLALDVVNKIFSSMYINYKQDGILPELCTQQYIFGPFVIGVSKIEKKSYLHALKCNILHLKNPQDLTENKFTFIYEK